MKKVRFGLSVNYDAYRRSKDIFEKYDLTFSDGISFILENMQDKDIAKLIKKKSFQAPLPELAKRIRNVENGENMNEYKNIEDMFYNIGL